MIYGLVGEKLSGKDTAAHYICERIGASIVRHSQILDEILQIFELETSRENEITLGLGLRKMFGEGILTKAVKMRVQSLMQHQPVVINGIRYPEELAQARDLGATIIYISAPSKLRYERFMHRHVKPDDGVGSFEEFMALEQTPTEVNIPLLGAQASYTIINDGSLEELQNKLNRILDETTSRT